MLNTGMSLVRQSLPCFRDNLPYIILGSIAITAVVIGVLAILKTTPFASFPYTDDLTGIAFTVAAFATLSCLVCGSYRRKRTLNIQEPANQIKDSNSQYDKASDLEFIKQELDIRSLHDSIRQCEIVSLEEDEIISEEVINASKSSNKGTRYLKCKDGSALILSCSRLENFELRPYTIAFCRQKDKLTIIEYQGDNIQYETAYIKKNPESIISIRIKKILTKGRCEQEDVVHSLK